jgi:HlyD family secretion protein
MKILDTAMSLTTLRDEIKNQRYTVEEAAIDLDQSKYEPPATIRKAELKLNREKRALEQILQAYKLRKIQITTSIRNQKMTLENQEQLVKNLQSFLSQFTITAPSDGMIIYKKDRLGNKRKNGSSINPFDNVVATLPDLTSMLSKVYVSEVEVTKVLPGQRVNITVDAFPEKSYTGTVISVGKIGEQLPNSDAKMFEVMIRIDGFDSILRPSMTTWNKIILSTIPDAVYIPLECVQTGTDSVPYVYKKNKTRQIVVLGEVNDKSVIVKQGLEPGTELYLVPPEDASSFRLVGEKLITSIKQSN